jgi:hypothetical protein
LHIFCQRAAGDPVRLRSFGIAQPGRAQQRALDGMSEGREKYVRKVRVALREAPHKLLRLQAEEVKPEGIEWKEAGISTISSSEGPVPRIESVGSVITESRSEENVALRSPCESSVQRAMSSIFPVWPGSSFMSDEHCLRGLGALRMTFRARAGHLYERVRSTSFNL